MECPSCLGQLFNARAEGTMQYGGAFYPGVNASFRLHMLLFCAKHLLVTGIGVSIYKIFILY